MSQYLSALADVLRTANLVVVELDGWATRGRSNNSQYADGRPWCVMVHHTASGGDGHADADYCTFGSPDAPICNLVIGREGIVYVCAAGPTNTNGKGRALTFSKGTVPADSMNTYAVGIELSSDGVGMTYPQAQIDACIAACNAITAAYGLSPDDVATHNHYAPDRKIDPATATAVQGPWQPASSTSSGTWDLFDLRAECQRRAGAGPLPGPTPTPPEDDMPAALLLQSSNGSTDQRSAVFWWDGKQIGWVHNGVQMNVGCLTGIYQGQPPFTNFDVDMLQGMIDSSWAGGPIPAGFRPPSAVDSGVT